MKLRIHLLLCTALCLPAVAVSQTSTDTAQSSAGTTSSDTTSSDSPTSELASGDSTAQDVPTFTSAAEEMDRRRDQSVAALKALREQIEKEQLPLTRTLREVEDELSVIRKEFNEVSLELSSRTSGLANMREGITRMKDDETFLATIFSQFTLNLHSRLHIAEMQAYEELWDAARQAPDNPNLTTLEAYRAQVELLEAALARLEDGLGGARYEGMAVDETGIVRKGTFLQLGPSAYFASDDDVAVGLVEERPPSQEANVAAFTDPLRAEAVRQVFANGSGTLPFDPTLGMARKIEEVSKETLVEHVQKGGPVMVPIFVMAGLALLVALFKWLALAFQRKPSKKRVEALLDAIGQRDEELALKRAAAVQGPAGRMLLDGVRNIREPRELVEEILFEHVLTARLKFMRFLPFIAICAAAAPLLGLLGTVTGIIETFKMITISGAGDVKSLSGGISKALITTEFGLIVAIPSLLLHAFLARKAKGIIGRMETSAVAFVNQISKTPFQSRSRVVPSAQANGAAAPEAVDVRAQVNEVLTELLGPLLEGEQPAQRRAVQQGSVPAE